MQEAGGVISARLGPSSVLLLISDDLHISSVLLLVSVASSSPLLLLVILAGLPRQPRMAFTKC